MKQAWVLAVLSALPAAAQEQEGEKRIERLIQALEDDSKESREKAVTDLIKIGRPALEALRKAAQSKDTEVKGLAQQAIEKIEWGQGLDKLRQHIKERYDDGTSPEPLKLKGVQKWFPETRFYEVGPAAAAGAAGMGGMAGGRSIFAVRKHEETFYRVIVRGILSSHSIVELLGKEKVRLKEHDEAFDFATAFVELYWQSLGGHMSWSGMASKFEKTPEGWELQSPNYGTHFLFKTDADGTLVDVDQSSRYYTYSATQQKVAEEKARLELEKLKMEIEVLKRQVEEGKRK